MTTVLHLYDDAGRRVSSTDAKEFVIMQTPDVSLLGPIVDWIPQGEITFDMQLTRWGRRYFRKLMRRPPVPAKRNTHRYGRGHR